MLEVEMPDLLRPKDVARMFDVDGSTVRSWLKSGLLPFFRTPGGQYRIRRADAEALMPSEPPKAEAAA